MVISIKEDYNMFLLFRHTSNIAPIFQNNLLREQAFIVEIGLKKEDIIRFYYHISNSGLFASFRLSRFSLIL